MADQDVPNTGSDDNRWNELAQLRADWAALSTALDRLAQGQRLGSELLNRIPAQHQTYLMGHESRARHLDEAWRSLADARAQVAALLDDDATTLVGRTTLARLLEILGGPGPVDSPGDAVPAGPAAAGV